MLERFFATLFFIMLLPLFLFLSFLIFVFSGFPIFFMQKRVGKNKKPFHIYKFRTMHGDAESQQKRYRHMNEADGPVFKMRNDPRYTKIGKIFSRVGLDELPQLLNIIKGDMVFVGPRPLPTKEAKQISKKYHIRFSVLPGITSPWVINGAHRLSFTEWMDLDVWYVSHKTVLLDIAIFMRTISMLLFVLRKYRKQGKKKH